MVRRGIGVLWWGMLGTWAIAACGDDGTDGSEGAALVDTLLALEDEEDELDCVCFPDPEGCAVEQRSEREIACAKQVVTAHAAEFDAELRCKIRKQEHENACLMKTCDVEPLEACEEAFPEDCDDTAEEAYEDEFKACSGAS